VNEDDDATLVRSCLAGHRSAFEQIVGRYQKPVFNAALRLLHDAEDAKDVAQSTFLKAFEHLGDYDPNFKFYSWIYRIALNESLNLLGKRKLHGGLDGESVDQTPGPEQQVEGEQTTRAIQDALMRIKPEMRSVLVLRHFLHLSYHDMSEVLLLPEKTVKSRLYSARQLLRDDLREHGTV
jgi:RNA polymerase sigma-70 factor (ECF subfamily)